MSISLNDEQLQQLYSIRYGSSATPFADSYDYVLSLISQDGAPAAGVDASIWQWFNGASQVNRGSGSFSQFIRSYTAEQVFIRYGVNPTPLKLQQASDSIADAVICDILTNHEIPSLLDLGNDDASGTATQFFQGDPAGWSGDLLFPLLGESSFLDNNLLETPGDTYDMLAAIKSAEAGGVSITWDNYAGFLSELYSLVQSDSTTQTITSTGIGAIALDIYDFMTDAYGQSVQLYAAATSQIVLDQKGLSSIITGSSNADFINAYDGDDTINVSGNADLIDGGSGEDTVDYTADSAITVDIYSDTTQAVFVGDVDRVGILNSDLLYNVENVIGSSGDDEFDLNSVDTRQTKLDLNGGAGDDILKVNIETAPGAVGRAIEGMNSIIFGGNISVTFSNFEAVSLGGEIPDVLLLSDSGATDVSHTIFDLGSSGNEYDSDGNRLADTIDASNLTHSVSISLLDISNEIVVENESSGTSFNIKNAEVAVGTAFNDLLIGGTASEPGVHELLKGGGGDDTIYALGSSDEVDGGSGNDKIFSEGDNGVVGGGADDDVLYLDGSSAVIKFGIGDGEDNVRTGSGNYELALDGLNPDDIELVAGGTDFIDTTGHLIPFQADFNVLVVRIKATGEQISFVKQSNASNMFDGFRARDGVTLSTNIAEFGDTIDQDGPYKYQLNVESVSNSPLNSIKFADGTTWSAETIWSKIADYDNNPDVSFDVLQPSGPGLRGGLLPSSEQAGARTASSTSLVGEQSATGTDPSGFSDPFDYIDHLNSNYFGAAPLSYPAGQDIEGTPWTDGLSDGYGNDTLNGGQGDDYYRPTFGDDRILWNVGDGNDVLEESMGSHFGNDTLVLGEGIAPSDVRFAAADDGAGLIISFADIDGSITLSNQVGALDGRGSISISFNDGTIWTHQDILAAASDVIANAHQSVVGTPGDDYLLSANYQDLVTNFTVQGGEGDDVIGVAGDGGGEIIFAKGDGHDMLVPDLTKHYLNDVRSDILSLTDILPSEVTFKRAGDALVITVTSTGDAFIAQSQFTTESPDAGEGVNQIAFGDGTIWTRSDILAAVSGTDGNDNLLGSSNVDWLLGGDYNDVLAGGLGNDLLDGGAGDDTYRFGIGDGQDVIRENNFFGNGGDDTIELATGIAMGNVTVSEENGGQDLVLRITGTDDQITIDSAISDPDARIETVSFADGTSWSFADLMVQATLPTDGDDTFFGSELSETLSGGAGNDTLIGGGGDDIYRFDDDGFDTIRDFSPGGASDNDTIELPAYLHASDVTVKQANDGSDLVLSTGYAQVTIMDAIHEPEARIEQAVFADGTVWNFADMMARSVEPTSGNDKFYGSELADMLSGGAGNDTLIGRDGSDVLTGGVGNDKLDGGGDGDIYRFSLGDGQDTISEFGLWGYGNQSGEDAIEFSSGIDPDDVIVSEANDGQDLVLQIAGTSDRITIASGITGPYGGNDSQIEKVRFANGTTWDFADLMARATVPTAGDDTIYGSDLSETLSGGAGNDTLIGREGDDVLAGGTGNDTLDGGTWGNDTYLFARGDGQDVIVEGYDDDNDALEFASGIAAGDVIVSQVNDGQDLVLQIGGTDDRVTIAGMNAAWTTNIEAVRFADGTIWSFADVMARATAPTIGDDVTYGSYLNETLSGGAGDDTLFGRDGDDVLVGGAGNDHLSGDAGNDIYQFARGDGQDVIEENSDPWGGGDENDAVEFASGIAPEDIIVTHSADGQSVILSIDGTNDSIELLNSITNEVDRVEQVRFFDGTVWSYSDMEGEVQAQPEQLVSAQPMTASASSEAINVPDHKNPAWRNMMDHVPRPNLLPGVQASAEQMTHASAMFGVAGSSDELPPKAPRDMLANIGHLSLPSPSLHPYQ